MVEIVISVVGEVAAKVAGCLLDPITRQLGYLFNYRRNLTGLNQQIQSLDREKERLQIRVDEANRQGDEIYPDVQEWLRHAEGIIQKREDFNEDEKKASKSCFYFKSRYQLSKQAKTQAGEIVVKIQQAHNFGDRVSKHPPPPPLISSTSLKDYEAFQSRESTFNQIMETLRNEDMSMIGVWGMGGVGKTTLVKQLAKQAEEDKLFHKVVVALNISQTPNIAEIQGKLASMLGLTLENNNERAVRLRQSLKNQGKILVIFDDIWDKLELGEIGIPYGDDHKGCKVLLTSRELKVLSIDMRTQKEFHLQHLSKEEAWDLFKKTAGDSVEKLELRPIAVEVVKKCEGLPIAIVTIANALKNECVPVWENALEELRRSAPTNIRGVSKDVYSCLELSYNHLKGDEVKSLFLLCGLLGVGDISMDRLVQYAMGLNLFKGLYSWVGTSNKLITLVKNLKASSLLLEDEDKGNRRGTTSLVFDRDDQNISIRMHDVVRDVARAIAFKDPHRFVVKEAVGLQEEWQWMDECRNSSRLSLKCSNIDRLPQGLVCPKLEFFLLNSSNDDGDSYLKIPDAFFQDTKQLRVLGLCEVSLTPSPSSLGFLSNLRTLCLNQCQIQDIAVIGELKGLQVFSLVWSDIKQLPKEMMQLSDLRVLDLQNCYKLKDIAVIGELKRLQVLSLAESDIEQLPKEMMQLSDLRVLDLRNCCELKVIPRNVISSLSRLEYLSMEGSYHIEWESAGFNTKERINACLSELKHLSGLRTLEVGVFDPSLLPEDDGLFDDLNLTRYSIEIGGTPRWIDNNRYKASRRLILEGVKSLPMVNCFSKLLKTSQFLWLLSLNDTTSVVHELDKEGFVELKYLSIDECPTIQYILHSTSTSMEWVPPRNSFPFPMLEEMCLRRLSNLEAVCHGPIPMGSFGNLRILQLRACGRLKYVFSLPTQNGRESAFPRLESLELRGVPELISFYSTESSDTQESVTFFNQQAAFPALESLDVSFLDNVRALWHNQLLPHSFSKLKRVHVYCYKKLLNVFPLSMVKALVQLEVLEIGYCRVLEAIVANENEDEDKASPLFLFPKLIDLHLSNLRQLKTFCFGRHALRCPLLKILEVYACREVEILFEEVGLEGDVNNKIQQKLFLVEKATFSSLESLSLKGLDNVRALWPNQLLEDSFSKLKKLYIDSCNKLLNVFPISVAKALVQLEDLKVQSCSVLEAIVANEDENEDELFLFPKLASLTLHSLHQLKRFCFGRFPTRWQLLKKLQVCNCDEVEILCQEIRLEEEIGLEDGIDNKIQQPLFWVQKGAFPNLEELSLSLKGTVEIWRGQFSRMFFTKLRVLNITENHNVSVAISSKMFQILHNFERLEVTNCDSVNEVIQVERLSDAELHVDTLSRLTELHLEKLPMLMHLSELGPYFQSLQTLEIVSCGGLINLVKPSMVKSLVQLKMLIIRGCNMMNEIVGNREDEPSDEDEIYFNGLKSLELEDLPNLKCFCSAGYTFQFPSLEEIKVSECPKMDFFCNGVLDAPRLKDVQAGYDFLQRYWKGDLNTTIHKMFMEQDSKVEDSKEEDSEEEDSNDSNLREKGFEEH